MRKLLSSSSRTLLLGLCALFYIHLAFHIGLDVADGGPDEIARSLVPKCIADGNLLPSGYDSCTRLHNVSYAFYPQVLGPYGSAFFMAIAKLFGASSTGVFYAGRLSSIVFSCLTLYFFSKTIEVVLKGNINSLFWSRAGIIFMGFLPQYAFISSYMNNDIVAFCGVNLMINACYTAIRKEWNYRNAIVLAVGICISALGYLNAFIFILICGIIFFLTAFINPTSRRENLKYLWLILGISCVVVLPFFIINFVRYGDFIGYKAFGQAMEKWTDGKSNGLSPWQGTRVQFLLDSSFFSDTFISFFGKVGYMYISIPFIFALCYFTMLCVGTTLAGKAGAPAGIESNKWKLTSWGMATASVLTLALSMYRSFTSDYQPQGRYIIEILSPLLLYTIYGIGTTDRSKPGETKNTVIKVLAVLIYACACLYFFWRTIRNYQWNGI